MQGSLGQDASGSDRICLSVAGLHLWLDSRSAKEALFIPPGHRPFLQHRDQPWEGDLVLKVRHGTPGPRLGDLRPLCRTEIWELWLNASGGYIFTAPHQSLPRRLAIESGFTAGEVWGNFGAGDGPERYPLHGLEIMLFANWLAGKGDIVLHAAGIEVDHQGYAFLGASGAGKSTLAAALARCPGVRILGEDQLVLRKRDGCFWIYGTPWHIDPVMCSPDGAPLKKIFFLDRFAEKTIEGIQPAEGLMRILQTAFVPYYRGDALPAILECIHGLCMQTPIWNLAYRLGSDILSTIRAA